MAPPIRSLIAAAVLLLSGCGDDSVSEGPIAVSIIGPSPSLAPVGRQEPPMPQQILLLAVAQGLVSLDASGRIEPGLAQRWIVSDDGLSYIFRLRRAEWRPGKRVTANEVVRVLRAALNHEGRNRLAPFFVAVDQINAVTPEILEIRLHRPRPHFLDLLTQPEMSILAGDVGSGPFRIGSRAEGAIALKPIGDPDFPEEQQAHYAVDLRAERTARAAIRYQRRDVDLVLGGTYTDLAVARAIDPPIAQLQFDPAHGLFGLAIVSGEGLLATPENRRAVAMAIDRDAIVRAFAVPGWQPATSIIPAQLELPAAPAKPDWATLSRNDRIDSARLRIAAWRGSSAEFPRLRIALPDGPGSRLLFTLIGLDLGRIGIIAERAEPGSPADLRLIDAVAPNDSATWYLTRLDCNAGVPCDEATQAKLDQSRLVPSLAERARLLGEIDAAYAQNAPFIPIASPVRWSLVRPSLRGFRANIRATHPLHRLLNE